ncbi:hypothetical protein H5410_035977 [Solanum commersonii]|uniref:Uncharacterized protein n=1 Tax=Solanum commersonii TaxID=4109 RepID=A0A9J5Y2T6_SOLCO|nr:hypothetical protein H5410_035977 [Solanum commersonii]
MTRWWSWQRKERVRTDEHETNLFSTVPLKNLSTSSTLRAMIDQHGSPVKQATNKHFFQGKILVVPSGPLGIPFPAIFHHRILLHPFHSYLSFFVPTIGDDTIYFVVGFKSFDITRGVSRAETWYDWVERGRKMMIRMSISQKTMEWLAFASRSIEADSGNSRCKWKYRDRPWSSFAQGITTNRSLC